MSLKLYYIIIPIMLLACDWSNDFVLFQCFPDSWQYTGIHHVFIISELWKNLLKINKESKNQTPLLSIDLRK